METFRSLKWLELEILLLSLLTLGTHCQRAVPGVNPQHYQQVPVQQQQQYQQQHPPPPQYQQQQQMHQQHMAPGVNPQQYQQVPVQQQHQQHQPQMQYQQVPVQQQAVPQQQQQQQHMPQQQQQHMPQQQQHIQQPHGQHAPHGQPQQVLHGGNMDNERAHIQEHMQVPIDTSKMSEAELQFHYFKMHDSDNNNKLDGCELIKSLIHWHGEEKHKKKPGESGTAEKEVPIYSDQDISDVVDRVLNMMDLNKDGFVDYAEYRNVEDEQDKGKKN